jgi:hypothetical protein
MGFVFVTGPCIVCKAVFSFNPLRVPSTSVVTGSREPICLVCIGIINERRKEAGLPAVPVADDAYEAIPEEELPG